jgi:hypothetical protein
VDERAHTVKQQTLLVLLGLSFSNLPHRYRRDPTSAFRRILKEFEESLHVLVKTEFSSFESFLRSIKFSLVVGAPQLHGSMPRVEKLADVLVLLLPIFLHIVRASLIRYTGNFTSSARAYY